MPDMTSGNDMEFANKTYEGFTSFVKWGTIVSAIVTIFVVMLIAS
ncbi:aa3-type cytochrome c oxidase subunit IV [Alterisphingorhabdus coralli]|uniref:Aa3-type cytochrome c oxidase subunit IV n=1 Tax=Alterisphingorhabdus coralli TaxID=3071408 RepID=A0AA97HZU5_9SPHN|nr:aa3-type cytochrome c oxidase subunit IV [Parasphingorhabdus sp. SCSIO 66989]WOE74207.1 aa3-type cytochrome c oxidase subunit IV [Parasphingorhabdus sp. SCSIO 66989]